MSAVYLYIGDELADIGEEDLILFNYTQEELTNPTIVKNSYSHQITLKGTDQNNRIFGNMYRLDRGTYEPRSSGTGLWFNPMKRLPFKIYDGRASLLESGYIKLDTVNVAGAEISYTITLYGNLGAFFYSLMYDDEGNKLTLADLPFEFINGSTSASMSAPFSALVLLEGWQYLNDPAAWLESDPNFDAHDSYIWNVINFAPAYNGLPDNFSADAALVNPDSFANISKSISVKDDSGVSHVFTIKDGASSLLVQMSSKHTEWEIGDLRWYLQRPVISVKAIIKAIATLAESKGYSFVFEEVDGTNLLSRGWITLPMISKEQREDFNYLDLLAKTNTPVEYLLSLAKMMGAYFVFDKANTEITLTTREYFYGDPTRHDLTPYVDASTLAISPVLAATRFYQFGGDTIGQFAKEYKADFGIDYGIQRVDTGNDFNSETTKLTEGIIFKNAVEVQERSRLFRTNVVPSSGTRDTSYFDVANFESVKAQYWGWLSDDDEEQSMEENSIEGGSVKVYYDNEAYPLTDWLAKVQLHEEEGKSIDGANVLLYFVGIASIPNAGTGYSKLIYLSNDHPDMDTLNGGEPCWNLTGSNAYTVAKLPSFRRTRNIDSDITSSLDWGQPKALGVVDSQYYNTTSATLYNTFWYLYLRDRYSTDTHVLSCKVNIRALLIECKCSDVAELLRLLFVFRGSLYVLNKVSNYSLTTYDDAECEFIKVQDFDNYV